MKKKILCIAGIFNGLALTIASSASIIFSPSFTAQNTKIKHYMNNIVVGWKYDNLRYSTLKYDGNQIVTSTVPNDVTFINEVSKPSSINSDLIIHGKTPSKKISYYNLKIKVVSQFLKAD